MRTHLAPLRNVLALGFGLALATAAPAGDLPKDDKNSKDPAADINKPRDDARKIAFTANEGTWMSVDVSPDGGTIVFDLLGDIYRVPMAGGAASPITTGPAFDSHPRFSPDGRT